VIHLSLSVATYIAVVEGGSVTPTVPGTPSIVEPPAEYTTTVFAPSLLTILTVPTNASGSATPDPTAAVVIFDRAFEITTEVATVPPGVAVTLSAVDQTGFAIT
jgi:hypothetical protein